jgi:hypothetical protein
VASIANTRCKLSSSPLRLPCRLGYGPCTTLPTGFMSFNPTSPSTMLPED